MDEYKNCKTCDKLFIKTHPKRIYCRKKCQPSTRKSRAARRKAEKLKIKHAKLPNISWGEIQEIYDNCPEGHHVDHIIPRNHELVCGLHVPCNLQYLPAEENMKKSNRFIISDIENP